MFEDRGIAAGATKTAALRVDDGMAQNAWFVQFLADVLDTPVEVPPSHETTALGAAAPAGIGCGLFTDAADFWRAMAIGPTPDAYNACQPLYGLARQLACGDQTRVGLTGAHNDDGVPWLDPVSRFVKPPFQPINQRDLLYVEQRRTRTTAVDAVINFSAAIEHSFAALCRQHRSSRSPQAATWCRFINVEARR